MALRAIQKYRYLYEGDRINSVEGRIIYLMRRTCIASHGWKKFVMEGGRETDDFKYVSFV